MVMPSSLAAVRARSAFSQDSRKRVCTSPVVKSVIPSENRTIMHGRSFSAFMLRSISVARSIALPMSVSSQG